MSSYRFTVQSLLFFFLGIFGLISTVHVANYHKKLGFSFYASPWTTLHYNLIDKHFKHSQFSCTSEPLEIYFTVTIHTRMFNPLAVPFMTKEPVCGGR